MFQNQLTTNTLNRKQFSVILLLLLTFYSFNAFAKAKSGESGSDVISKPEAAQRAQVEAPALAFGVPIGSYAVNEGPVWTTNPPTYTCLEACAMNFGGSSTDYACSTESDGINNLAWASTWGTPQYCVGGIPVAGDFKLNDFYDCGSTDCSVSAYVDDHCGSDSINYCYLIDPPSTVPVPSLTSWGLVILVALLGLVGLYIRRRFIRV